MVEAVRRARAPARISTPRPQAPACLFDLRCDPLDHEAVYFSAFSSRIVPERALSAIYIPLVLALCVPPLSSGSDSLRTVSLQVMSYNIRYDTPQDTGQRAWRNRRKQIASLIRFHAPDVVGTQEGKLHQLIDLEERLRNYEWIGVGRRSGGDEFSALFYRTDRLTLLEHGTFWLSKTPNTPGSKSWGAALPRIATWARFRDQASGDTLFVLNTHFDHESEKARIKSTRLITESLETLSESAPVVVMGDINALPDSRPYSLFTRAGDDAPPVPLRDAKRVAKQAHYGPTSTYTHFEPTVRPGQRYDISSWGQASRCGDMATSPHAGTVSIPPTIFRCWPSCAFPDSSFPLHLWGPRRSGASHR